eukprot:COSAG01_NODE_8782_length_2661_cov_2.311085_2_plen_122_part_00
MQSLSKPLPCEEPPYRAAHAGQLSSTELWSAGRSRCRWSHHLERLAVTVAALPLCDLLRRTQSDTGAGEDHGIDHNSKNWLRFPYVFHIFPVALSPAAPVYIITCTTTTVRAGHRGDATTA